MRTQLVSKAEELARKVFNNDTPGSSNEEQSGEMIMSGLVSQKRAWKPTFGRPDIMACLLTGGSTTQPTSPIETELKLYLNQSCIVVEDPDGQSLNPWILICWLYEMTQRT